MTSDSIITRGEIGEVQAQFLNQPRYSKHPLSPPFFVQGQMVEDPVKVVDQITLVIDPGKFPEFVSEARDLNAPLILENDRGERVKAVIQSTSPFDNPVRVRVQPEN
jgi:hypothetical protein